MIKISDFNLLISILKNEKKNVLFGAGDIGKILSKTLLDLNINVDFFLVNDHHKNSEFVNNIPVVDLSNFSLREEECNIIYSINKVDKNIYCEVDKKYKNNFFYFDTIKMVALFKLEFFKDYFKKENISIDNKKIIDFKGTKIVNPFYKSYDYIFAFSTEVGDILFAPITNDFNHVVDGPYELGNVKINKNDIVLDCGANIGLFSAYAASKGAKVCAFEPLENLLPDLNEVANIYKNSISVFSYALADKTDIIDFYYSPGDLNGSSLLNVDNKKEKKVKVKSIRLDDFVEKYNINKIDFIKADIEGAERYMLLGAKNILKKYGPKLSICTYHLPDDKKTIEKIIKNINSKYKIIHKWGKIYAHIPNKSSQNKAIKP